MTVILGPQLEEIIRLKVQSGRYQSVDQVISEALHLLEERDQTHHERLEKLRAEIAIGVEQADRGELREVDEALLEEIKDRGRERLGRLRGSQP